MKQFFTLLAVVLIFGANAQKYNPIAADSKVLSQSGARAVADTLLWNIVGQPQLYLMPDPFNPTKGIGFIAGTDNLVGALDPPNMGSITTENAQIFTSKHKIRVMGAKFTFGAVKYVSGDTNSIVAFKLFKLDGNFINYGGQVVPGPGTVISNVEVPIRDIKQLVSGQETLFSGAHNVMFPTPLEIDPATADSGYVIGFDIAQLSPLDTLGLFTSMIGGTIIKERSLVRFDGNPLFNSFRDTLDYGGWGLDLDLAIFPIIDPNQHRNDAATICSGDTFTFNGKKLFAPGTYVDTFSALPLSNYDTIVTLQLTVAAALDKSVTASGDTLNANQTAAIYQWYDCNGDIPVSGETSRTFIASADGQYKVSITKGGCTTFSSCIAVGDIGIHEAGEIGFALQPNPTHGNCTLYMNDLASAGLSAYIYNMQGQVVKTLFEKQFISSFSFNTSELSSGMYFIHLTDGDGKTGMKKLVVE